MKDRFRIDVQLLGEDSLLSALAVYGETLEIAVASAMVLMAPHIDAGLMIHVLNMGVFCDECTAYHPCTERLLKAHSEEEVETESAGVGPN